jgi:Tol biopolymer transport system component
MNLSRIVIATLLSAPAASAAPPAPVTALAYSPDGKTLAAGAHRDVILLDAAGTVLGRLPAQSGSVTALAFTPDGKTLAVAAGAPSKPGEVRLYPVPGDTPARTIAAHKDSVYGLAVSPDGKTLATCGYDRLVKLWNLADGAERATLKDHSDAVYGVDFSPDGKLLASVAADRAVKVWDVATSQRLYTLGDATDWLYAVAWSPDGRHLAAAGVDKSIRVWQADAHGGKLVHTSFAHEGAVTRLAYSPDGQTLYSLGEDRALKAWDAGTLAERTAFPKQPDAALALAVRPDGKQLALGRYDGALLLIDPADGKVTAEPLPVKAKSPQVARLSPDAGPRGRTVRVTFTGTDLDAVTEAVAGNAGVTVKLPPDRRTPTTLAAEVTVAADATPNTAVPITLKSAAGAAKPATFTVDRFPRVAEREPNDAPSAGQLVPLNSTVVGALNRPGDVDFYRFEAPAGRQVGVEAVTASGAFEPVLQWLDAAGAVLAEGHASLGVVCPQAGTYVLAVRDRDYRGKVGYRLHVGDVPVVTAAFPLGLARGGTQEVHLDGVHLTDHVVRVTAPAEAGPGSKLPVPAASSLGTPLGLSSLVVGEFTEVGPGATSVPVPGTANGRLASPGATDTWTFTAKKGQRLILETNARRLGSPLDSWVEVLDAAGRPIPRATLRCVAKTVTVLRDHNSAQPGIRLEAWNEFAVDDYILIGHELMRIAELPKGPDDDTQFYAVAGQRVAYLDTTPSFHSLGSAAFKVQVHPPGASFSPNGLPLVPVYYRNDDGGAGYGKDSRLVFDPPGDGEYKVRVGDSRGQGGPAYAYRLTVRPPKPDFTLSFTPNAPSVWRGGSLPVGVTATRLDDFTGPIDVRLEGLPPGFECPASRIDAEQTATTLTLWANPDAKSPAEGAPKLKLVGRAVIDGRVVEREAMGGRPKVVEPRDVVTTTAQSEVTIRPGQETHLDVTIERLGGFKDRVPLEVRGLPHGVRVMNIGLNGILITERETSRRVVLYAEPWVQPVTLPLAVAAKLEGKNTEHGARPVTLRVEGPK